MAQTAEENPPQTAEENQPQIGTEEPEETTEEEYVRDDTFYDDAIVFIVENVNFRVSRILLRCGSEVFATMLSLPQTEQSSEASREGASDTYPITLPGVAADEFKEFLRVLYANLVEINNPTGITNVTSNWRSVLKLATLWEFGSIRKHAIRTLRAEQPVDQIVLAKMYDIKGWMEDALYVLVHREEPLIFEDFSALGLDLSIRITHLREMVLKHSNRTLERPGEWHKCVRDVFGEDFVQGLKQEWGTSYF